MLRRPPYLDGATLFHADHLRQRFTRHVHDEYALGVITRGVLGFDYRGSYHLAGTGEINLVVPGEVHDGHPALGETWSYRMFYLPPRRVCDIARQMGGGDALPFFRTGVIQDPALAVRVATLHRDALAPHHSALEIQSRLVALLAEWIRRYGETGRAPPSAPAVSPNLARVRDFLEACWQQKPALDTLAGLAALSPYHFLRAFTRQYGLPPHTYLLQRQVREARRLLDDGWAIADAAFAAGFADQSHLNRHFKRTLGVTPGQYRDAIGSSV